MSDAALGYATASYACGLIVFALPAGWVIGRVGPRMGMIVALVVLGAATVSFGLAATPE